MGDVNLEIKLTNLDERVIKIEESGGGSGGDGYITSVSNDFNVVNKKLSLSNNVTTKLSKVGEQSILVNEENIKINTSDISDNREGLTETFEATLTNTDDAAINRQAIEELYEMLTAESEVK